MDITSQVYLTPHQQFAIARQQHAFLLMRESCKLGIATACRSPADEGVGRAHPGEHRRQSVAALDRCYEKTSHRLQRYLQTQDKPRCGHRLRPSLRRTHAHRCARSAQPRCAVRRSPRSDAGSTGILRAAASSRPAGERAAQTRSVLHRNATRNAACIDPDRKRLGVTLPFDSRQLQAMFVRKLAVAPAQSPRTAVSLRAYASTPLPCP